MAGSVERALEETVSVLHAARRAKLLSSLEIDQVVRTRRDHEYALKKRNPSRNEFLKYAAFERELANILEKRARKRNVKKKTVQLVVGKTSSRVNLVYSRAVKALRGDVELWLHYARHCVRTGSIRTAQKVLARAIAYRGDSERVWLAAIALHFDSCGDANGARTLAQRALRSLPHSKLLWKEYFRLESSYLSKLVVRRLAIGLTPTPESTKLDGEVSSHIAALDKETATKDSQHNEAISSEVDDSEEGVGAKDSSSDHYDDADGEPEKEIENEASHASDSESSEGGSEVRDSDSSTNESSAEESDDPDGKKEPVEMLSFWDGGVPLTVFRRACDKVSFSSKDLDEIWRIAVSSPYIPARFLETMSSFILQNFPDRVISRIIRARVDSDCAMNEDQRAQATQAENMSDPGASLSAYNAIAKKRLLGAFEALPDHLRSTFPSSALTKFSETERKAVEACITKIEIASKKGIVKRQMLDELSSLLVVLDSEVTDEAINPVFEEKAPDSEKAEHAEASPESWSIHTLHHAIAQGKSEDGSWKYGEVALAMKNVAIVPFRGMFHDKVITNYFAIETNVAAIREVSDLLLATPPLTMPGLQCMIEAELRVSDQTSPQSEISSETKKRVRKLFSKCETLKRARQDVHFWLHFIDFERRKCKDSSAASVVYAKALRILDKEKVQLFTELLTLRNLG